MAGGGAKRVVGGGGRRLAPSASEAAFANGVASHALDFDDSHPGSRGHASASLVSAVLAAGEVARAGGRDVLAAYALRPAGAGKIGRALGPGHLQRGWHPTATIGVLGATAAAARLAGLDADGLQRAWGLAASQMGGLVRNFGTMVKPFHAGQAARCGVLSAWMAGEGLSADGDILDGKGGALDTYRGADGLSMDELLGSLGKPWEVIEPGNYVKRWPCCYSGHRTIGGLYKLIERHRLKADEIEEVTIGFLPGGDSALVSRDPKTGLEGKFSVEYMVAALLLDGALTLETFTDARVRRPQARALMRKVRRAAIADDKVYSGIAGYNDLAVTTARGRFELRVDHVPGSPAWPMSEEDRAAKFMNCAARVLGDAGAGRLLELAQRCHALKDVRELARATAPAAARPRRRR